MMKTPAMLPAVAQACTSPTIRPVDSSDAMRHLRPLIGVGAPAEVSFAEFQSAERPVRPALTHRLGKLPIARCCHCALWETSSTCAMSDSTPQILLVEEDPILLEANRGAATHEDRRPPECELSATAFALAMIEKYDLTGKLCHYSVQEGLPPDRAVARPAISADGKQRGSRSPWISS